MDSKNARQQVGVSEELLRSQLQRLKGSSERFIGGRDHDQVPLGDGTDVDILGGREGSRKRREVVTSENVLGGRANRKFSDRHGTDTGNQGYIDNGAGESQ